MLVLSRLLVPALAVVASTSAQLAPLPPLAPVPLTPAQPIVWNMAGELHHPRAMHTATLLNNGKVLVVGGYNSAGDPTTHFSAELFDPVTRTWSLASELFYGRMGHAATLLLNGRVLVTGSGRTEEIYNPATNGWYSTSPMLTSRTSHTATRLFSGQVLVAGGYNPAAGDRFGYLSSAELYDPDTHTWTPVGKMNAGRWGHVANFLPDGKVLVAGGFVTDGLSNSAEVFDPMTNTWSVVGGMFFDRVGQMHRSSILLDGRVVITGGYINDRSSASLRNVEVFDYKSRNFYSVGSLNQPRRYHDSARLTNGRILVAGGYDRPRDASNQLSLTSTETFDPSSMVWTDVGHLNIPRSFHTLTALPDGRVLAVGGTNNIDPQRAERTSELFNSGFGIKPRRFDGTLTPISSVRSARPE